MDPFSTPNPTTYAALLDILRNEALPYPIAPLDLDRMDYAASRMAHLRAYASFVNCYSCGNKMPQPMLMGHLIDELERIGVRGWVASFDERPMHLAFAKSRRKVEALEEKERELLAKIEALEAKIESLRPIGAPTNAPPAVGLQQQQEMLQYEEENIEKLLGLTERLEKLVDSKEAEAGGLGETRAGRPSSIHEDMQPSDDESERQDRETRNTQLEMGHGRPNRKPRPFSESSVDVEVGSSYIHSPATSVTGTGLSSNAEYSPPLRRSTEYEKEDDDTNAKLLEEENALWINEQEELHQSLTPDNPPVSQSLQPLSPSGIDSTPSYIYIPLPANFTLPQRNAHLPSLTFKTPPSVFHFPQGAKKDQLLSVLRQRCATGLPIPHLEPLEGINVMQVRTHHMEWELKNAIRKSMTQEQWESKVSNQWYTEGQGDTYIVSRTDVYFHGVSGSATDKSGEGRANGKSRVWMSDGSESEDDGHAIPRLRGGAPSYRLEDQERRSFAALSSGSWDFDIPDDYRDVLDDIDEASERGFQKAYIEYARILQLRNASQDRMIERLQDIIEDMEKTFDWQDNMLDNMHHRIEHWKHETKTAADEATRAWKEVDAAKAETEELRALLNDINEQVRGFYEQLEQELEQTLMYGDAEEWGGSKLPEIRGGGNSSRQRPSSPSPKTALEHGETNTQGIDATAFYFFPSVSIMVLLTSPRRYFQWPRHTSLAQARDILERRHVRGLEDNPHLRHIREIMEIREEMGFSLPDTADGRQVLIALPETENNFVSENAGRGSKWDQ